MNIARKLALLTLSAITIMALAASTASAVTVSKEVPPNVLCDVTVTEEVVNNCPIRSEANDIEFGAPFGVMYTCDVTLEGNINRAGHAIMRIYTYGSCEDSSLSICTTVGHRHPETQIGTLIAGGTAEAGPYNLTLEICINGPFGDMECRVSGTYVRTSTHRYSVSLVHTNKCFPNASYSLQGAIPLRVDAAHPGYELS